MSYGAPPRSLHPCPDECPDGPGGTCGSFSEQRTYDDGSGEIIPAAGVGGSDSLGVSVKPALRHGPLSLQCLW